MKKVLAVALLGMFSVSLAIAQDQNNLVKIFSRGAYFGGAKLNFMLLNDKTIDILFAGSSKDTIKAKIASGIAFYVLGIAEKDAKLDTNFVLEQNNQKTTATITDIKNFVDGEKSKGEKFSGIIQFDKKIQFDKGFSIRNPNGVVDFRLSIDALRLLPN
jgi:hypothetical protein